MHKLIDVEFNPNEIKKLRKWSGSCKCGRWNGMGIDKKYLKKLWKNTHLRSAI